MPRFNLYDILYSGGLSPQERIQQAIESQKEKELRNLSNQYSYAEDQLLTEATAEFPNDPYGFSIALFNKYTEMADALNEAIEMLGDDASVSMKRQRDKYREEANKYWAVITALDGITRARVKGDAEKEAYYKTRLQGYAVVYDALPTGEIKSMRIEPVYKLPSGAKPTNIGFTIGQIDKEGKPVISAIDADKDETGATMRAYVRGFNPDITPQARLGGFVLEWTGDRFRTIATNDALRAGKREINWEYGLQRIHRASLLNYNPGDVVKDSKGKFYYVNYDGSLAPVGSKKVLDWLGVKPDTVYTLTPSEEEALPSETTLKQFKPDPLMQLINKFNAEAEETLRSAPAPWQVRAGEMGERIYQLPFMRPLMKTGEIMLRPVSKTVREGARELRNITGGIEEIKRSFETTLGSRPSQKTQEIVEKGLEPFIPR